MSFSNEKIIEELLWLAHQTAMAPALSELAAELVKQPNIDRVSAYETAARQLGLEPAPEPVYNN